MSRSRFLSLSLAVFCLVCALIAALIVLPARWLMLALPDNAMASIADASGTVWQGSAQLALGPRGARYLLPEPIRWQWNNGALEVSHTWLRGPIRIEPGLSGVKVSGQHLQAPAGILTAFGAPLNTVAPGGQISLNWQAFVVGHLPDSGTLATGRWTQASSALSHVRPLGDYRLQVSAKNGAAQLAFTTEAGLLTATGHGTWEKGRLQFSGTAQASDTASDAQRAALTGILTALGPVSNGISKFGTPPRR